MGKIRHLWLAITLIVTVWALDMVSGQPSIVEHLGPCRSGEGVVVRQAASMPLVSSRQTLLCQPCPPETFSELNSLSGLRVCSQCSACAPLRRVIRPCSLARDTVCGECITGYQYDFEHDICTKIVNENSEDVGTVVNGGFLQRTFSENEAVVIVTVTAGVLCAIMLLIMISIVIKQRCGMRRNTKKTVCPSRSQCKNAKIYTGAQSAYKGPYNSVLIQSDEQSRSNDKGKGPDHFVVTSLEARLLP